LSGNVYVVIPNSQPGGIAYRLRVLSSDPQLISLPNASDITVNESPADSLKINGNTAICSGDSLRMSVKSGTGFTFEWFYNNSKIASDSFIYASAAGKYFAQISAPNGCVAKTKEATISVFNGRPNPVIKNIGNTSFCIGGNVALYVPKVIGETYQWRYNFADIAGATDTSIIATQTGSYEILVTNGCGSVLSAPAVVYSNPLPIVSISGKSNICQGESVNFIAKFDSVYTYQWYKNDTLLTGATNDTLLINTDGTYSVIITNPFGCSDTAVKTLTIDPIPDASISYNGLAQICQGKILNLSANAGFQSYQWYLNGTIINGASQAMYSASQAGDYKVRVITAIGCSATTQNPVKVSVNSLPVKPTITSNGSILTASSANNYQWFVNNNIINGATQKDYNTNYIAGKYAVLISDSNSCEALSDPFEILGISQTARRGQHAIFPNPTTGIIHVSLSGNLKVYDISGKIVVELKEQFNGEERVIDLSEFPAGIYIIQIDSQFHRVNLIK
jgi:hypothetical protein